VSRRREVALQRRPRAPSQIVAADLFVVPTTIISAATRPPRARSSTDRYVAVTEHPTAAWTAQPLRNAFPENAAPGYLLHDRDAVYAGRADHHRGNEPPAGSNGAAITVAETPTWNALLVPSTRVPRSGDRLQRGRVAPPSTGGLRRVRPALTNTFGAGRGLRSRARSRRRQRAHCGQSRSRGLHHCYERKRHNLHHRHTPPAVALPSSFTPSSLTHRTFNHVVARALDPSHVSILAPALNRASSDFGCFLDRHSRWLWPRLGSCTRHPFFTAMHMSPRVG